MNEAAYRAILQRLRVEADPPLHDEVPLSREPLARLLKMPLDVFACQGQPLELRVRWWPETLWLVPDVRDAEALWREGTDRHRVWVAKDLITLLGAAPYSTEALSMLMVARREFDGEVVAVRPRSGDVR